MKVTKKHRLYIPLIMGLLLLLIGGTYLVYAAMTAQDKKHNDFQIGQVETKLLEVFDGVEEIEKEQEIDKEVRIENTGTIKQFIRVMVLPEVKAEIDGDPENKQLLPLVNGTQVNYGEMAATWADGGDGYYYYLEAVEPRAKTGYLFKSVTLAVDISDRYHHAEFSIYLKVEAINCAEFAYRNAWWQGNTPGDGEPLKTIDDALTALVEN